jgi:predicted NBD/HSP70 family sugar kinase
MNVPLFLGVDLGGTQLRMALVSQSGELVTDVLSVPTGRAFEPDHFVSEIAGLVERMRELVSLKPVALGIGTPGVLVDQTISESDNLPLLNGSNLGVLANRAVDLPVRVENDARCFALAEARFGAGQGARSICGLTLGTGVGCGVIIDSEVYRGSNWAAGEVYRIPLRGFHLEYFLSGPGLVRSFLAAGGKLPEGTVGTGGVKVAELARSGNAAALKAFSILSVDLHFACECLISLIDPEVIVIGGSIAQSRDLFGDELARRLEGRPTRIAYANLGTAAGVIGAAALNIRAT